MLTRKGRGRRLFPGLCGTPGTKGPIRCQPEQPARIRGMPAGRVSWAFSSSRISLPIVVALAEPLQEFFLLGMQAFFALCGNLVQDAHRFSLLLLPDSVVFLIAARFSRKVDESGSALSGKQAFYKIEHGKRHCLSLGKPR